MSSTYFGTDGIRGPANGPVLRPDVVVRIGQAVGSVVRRTCGHDKPIVVIGKDTRLSGYMLESALETALTSVGFTCMLVGPLPTPAVAMLTRSLRADLGVMITASHNPYDDNGLKFFGADGIKLQPNVVAEVEHLVDHAESIQLACAESVGRAKRIEDAVGRYIEYIKTSIDKTLRLDGLKIVVDAANGAAYKIAPWILWELGAEVIKLGCEPDGLNINAGVGATAPEALQAAVLKHRADIGLALDGDADRLLIVDETGRVVDGDAILAALGTALHAKGKLPGSTLVGTQMSNMGFEAYLNGQGIALVRTPVGDHHVEAALREGGYALGGEPNGHLIFKEWANSGDGLLAALQVLAYLVERQAKASSLGALYTPYPMVLENVRLPAGTNAGAVLDSTPVQSAIEAATAALGTTGRVLVRKSGTEPLIRVMVEAQDEVALATQVTRICTAVRGSLVS